MYKVLKSVCFRENLHRNFKIYLTMRKFTLNANILYDPQNDFYTILNIKEKADIGEIKKSFFSLSKKLHPDKGGNENDFKKLNAAYEVLKNDEYRRQYDRLKQEHLKEIDDRVYHRHVNKETNRKENKSYKSDSNYHKGNSYGYNKNYSGRYDYNDYKTSYNYNNQNKNNDDNKEFYYGNRRNEDANSENNRKNKAYDYDYYTEFNEFIKNYQNYYNSTHYSKQNQSQFEKLKINIKYTPTKEINYADFIIEKSHKLHKSNRMEFYSKLKLINYIKLGYNPFEIHNKMMDDVNFLDTLKSSNKIDDDETFDKKISLKDIFGIYRKSTLFLFLLVNMILLTNIFIK